MDRIVPVLTPCRSQIDAEKLAERLGMTNPRSATNAWAAIRKKLVERNAELGGSDDIGPNKLGRPGKRKAGGSSDGENTSSPTKRGRGRPPKGETPKKAAKRGGKMNTTEHDSPAHQAQRADDAQQSEGHESPIKVEPNEAEVEVNAGEI
jgi:hypothetical protein